MLQERTCKLFSSLTKTKKEMRSPPCFRILLVVGNRHKGKRDLLAQATLKFKMVSDITGSKRETGHKSISLFLHLSVPPFSMLVSLSGKVIHVTSKMAPGSYRVIPSLHAAGSLVNHRVPPFGWQIPERTPSLNLWLGDTLMCRARGPWSVSSEP